MSDLPLPPPPTPTRDELIILFGFDPEGGLDPDCVADWLAKRDAVQAAAIESERAKHVAPTAEPVAHCVRELLAVMNGDGGHYLADHGLEAACKRAEERYYAHPPVPVTAEPVGKIVRGEHGLGYIEPIGEFLLPLGSFVYAHQPIAPNAEWNDAIEAAAKMVDNPMEAATQWLEGLKLTREHRHMAKDVAALLRKQVAQLLEWESAYNVRNDEVTGLRVVSRDTTGLSGQLDEAHAQIAELQKDAVRTLCAVVASCGGKVTVQPITEILDYVLTKWYEPESGNWIYSTAIAGKGTTAQTSAFQNPATLAVPPKVQMP